ncbi:hypothetical protein [Nocardioides sp. CFH 31398]|uniref:hypothetical protein n=1 Tax=Nocardioides sp. CFH 31398 TaxID=2919579 RepID=UPI001F05AACD|nr:hypothetical protein [Nocardioides sp. CFH 31398]MCH1867439.1 hypothetical protein [Nocardioides sp. CFH 31398]
MTDTTTTTRHVPDASGAAALREVLEDFRRRFADAVASYDGSTRHATALEQATAEYAALVTDERHEAPFAALVADPDALTLVDDLRAVSARCAAITEKYRALRLLDGAEATTGYFANVESCIADEFGALGPTSASSVLLVGSGSFPMTLLHVAALTDAAVAGVDIDPEAVDLGRRVVGHLDPRADITIERREPDELEFARRATHVVFSSTIPVKYALLDRLHPVTRDDVVVAMRYGDGLKSLFNYPRQEVDPQRWRLAETVRRPGQVFDVAVYTKPRTREAGR